MDTELFELCKEVYEKTRWDKTESDDGFYWNWRYVFEHYPSKGKWGTVSRDDIPAYEQYKKHIVAPLYTSDYLLEKLPKKLKRGEAEGSIGTGYNLIEEKWDAMYGENNEWSTAYYQEFANTPLKALLKLTIALHKAGELK